MIALYTIGFTGKSAEQFFSLLKNNAVSQLTDTRVNVTSQLAGFAKGSDLAFFTKSIVGIDYSHNLDLAPTKELLTQYRDKKMSWDEYEIAYLNLLDMRKIAAKIDIETLHGQCLLCSEHTPEKCHRRLLAEFFQQRRNDVQVTHLL